MRCRYNIEKIERDAVTIRDVGDTCAGEMTVTNDARAVVQNLREAGYLPIGRRLYYYEPGGGIGEIVVDAGGFVGFAPGVRVGR